jgi:hypothetical protein
MRPHSNRRYHKHQQCPCKDMLQRIKELEKYTRFLLEERNEQHTLNRQFSRRLEGFPQPESLYDFDEDEKD